MRDGVLSMTMSMTMDGRTRRIQECRGRLRAARAKAPYATSLRLERTGLRLWFD